MKIFKILTFYDIALMCFVFFISLLSLVGFIFFWGENSSGQKYAVIKIDNQEIQRYSLDKNSKIEKFNFEIDGKQYEGELVIDNDRVRLKRLSEDILPLSIHADTGWINNQIKVIVALPIKLTVQIEADYENTDDYEYDGIVY